MAGDVQQPFSLSFQVDALHSSSISFGRFELESLSWERKSSFSHNRYLEEVEKCAKPGSVTEKKAYFEAHFRKRALLRQASSVSQAEIERTNSDSSSYTTSTCDENHRDLIHGEDPQQIVENSNVCQDESPKGSSHDEDFRVFKCEAGLMHNLHSESSPDNMDNILKCQNLEGDVCGGEFDDNVTAKDRLELKLEPTLDTVNSVESVKRHENVETRESESTLDQILMINVQEKLNLESEVNDQNPDVKKEKCISGCTVRGMIKQPSKLLKVADKTSSSGLGSRLGGDASLTCEFDVKKGISQTKVSTEKRTPLKAKALKQTSSSITANSQSSIRQLKESPQNLKTKSHQESRSTKELRPKRAVTPQPSTPEKSESRRQRPASATSSTRQDTSTRKETGQRENNYIFRNNGGTEKKREKIMAADIKKVSRMPDMKEKQKLCPSLNAVPRLSNIQKPQGVPSHRLSAKASERTVQSENQTTAKSKPSSVSRIKEVVSSTKSAFKKETDDVQNTIDTNGSTSTRNHVIEAKQINEVLKRKERQSDKKQKPRENVQTMKAEVMMASNNDGLGKSGHSFLRKSLGHNSCVSHDAVTNKEAPKVGSGRNRRTSLRTSMGF